VREKKGNISKKKSGGGSKGGTCVGLRTQDRSKRYNDNRWNGKRRGFLEGESNCGRRNRLNGKHLPKCPHWGNPVWVNDRLVIRRI